MQFFRRKTIKRESSKSSELNELSHNNDVITCKKFQKCLMLGFETNEIHTFFENFKHFKYVTNMSKLPGTNKSSNGSIRILTHKKGNHSMDTIIKSSLKLTSDNLLYEFLVGNFINKLSNQYPCFVRTYGLYLNKESNHFKLLDIRNNDIYKIACENTLQLYLMTQFIPNVSLNDYMMANKKKGHFENDMLCILFQIYSILDKIRLVYTHYDLHDHNVILYQLPKDEYITMYYTYKNGQNILFKTNIIAKIIDYGRSYYFNTEKSSKSVCKERSCNTGSTCGTDKGFGYIKKRLLTNNHWINSYKKNTSHDLRLTQFIKSYISVNTLVLHRIINKIYYREFYGTPENNDKSTDTIYNVSSFIKCIAQELDTVQFRKKNDDIFQHQTHLGKMTIDMHNDKKLSFSYN